MNHRKVLFGYQYQSAELVLQPEEAETVTRIYQLYLSGLSYQRTADILNGECIPFSSEDPLWNKNKVKRVLSNPRYAGADGYPPIIESSLQQEARDMTQGKRGYYSQERIALRLRDRVWCGLCGKRITVSPRSGSGKDTLHMVCQMCEWELDIEDASLLDAVDREAMADRIRHRVSRPYAPSADVVRLANAINRELEKPENPEEVMSHILQGVSARYDCCSDSVEQLPKADRKTVLQRIARIDVSEDGVTAVTFQTDGQDR